ncbi:3'-5' exoribonuclease [Roseomonas sp. 18066]|uniref:3'-5' exoribonuclease n=1 Tax=Roseomonas sp. 18066 TaxID=2681412 RepID=UPI001356EB78|nr:3'-5' exoribonuclease [Roseomonas sp. 18066]
MTLYVVVDIETDGPNPGSHSLLSFGAVACRAQGAPLARFAVNLLPLPGAAAEPRTMAWWATEPEAWAAATSDPLPAAEAMARFVDWLRGLPEMPVFAGHPVAFDGFWIDWYLRRFTGHRLMKGPYDGERIFLDAALDIPTLASGVLGLEIDQAMKKPYPEDWFGGHAHTHCALDDALGYAALLQRLLARRPALAPAGAPSP